MENAEGSPMADIAMADDARAEGSRDEGTKAMQAAGFSVRPFFGYTFLAAITAVVYDSSATAKAVRKVEPTLFFFFTFLSFCSFFLFSFFLFLNYLSVPFVVLSSTSNFYLSFFCRSCSYLSFLYLFPQLTLLQLFVFETLPKPSKKKK